MSTPGFKSWVLKLDSCVVLDKLFNLFLKNVRIKLDNPWKGVSPATGT